MSTYKKIERGVQAYLEDPGDSAPVESVVGAGLAALPVLRDQLRRDLDIARTEIVESLLKGVLKRLLHAPVSGETARELALFQQDLGLLLKYKSYAIKAASPLGYAVFLQNDGEGFSYQRHITHKTEVFHILDVKPGGFVFLCHYDDWSRHYDRVAFDAWLRGEAHPFFDRCRFTPSPGDVFVISELGIVHTVVGCVLEEYATVSTDMVERLHDQNAGKSIPERFNRRFAEAGLKSLRLPHRHRQIDLLAEGRPMTEIRPERIEGGDGVVLTDSFVTASCIRLQPGARGALNHSADKATFVRIFHGAGKAVLVDETELDRADSHGFKVVAGDTLFVPPGIRYRLSNEASSELEYSEHRISLDVAFV